MGASDLPQDRRLIPSLKCDCGGVWFINFRYHGPNIAGDCEACGKQTRSWVPKAAIGLAKVVREKRDGIDPFKRSEVLARYRHRCAWCGIEAKDAGLEVGHIVPYAFLKIDHKDLADHPVNLAPTCRDCNEAAHKVRRGDFDVCMLLSAAIAYMAGPEGKDAA